MKKAALFLFLLALLPMTAKAQTFGEKSVGAACSNGGSAADFDTLAQCSATSGAGTMKKAPIILGTVTAPPYAATTCDTSKAGMLQWTGAAFQGCNGTSWSVLGSGSGGGGWVNVGSTIATNLSVPTTWTTLDLSPVVGTNQTVVMLELKALSADRNIMLRPQGVTNSIGYTASAIFGGGISACAISASTSSCFVMVQTSATGKIEIAAVSVSVTATVVLTGYIPPSSAFVPNIWSLNGTAAYYTAGNVGIATATPSYPLDVTGIIHASSLIGTDTGFVGKGFANYGSLALQRASGSLASPTVVASGDLLGVAMFGGYDGAAYQYGAVIAGVANGTIAAGSVPTDLIFSTGTSNFGTEKMRITSVGKVGIGTPTPTEGTILDLGSATATNNSSILLPKGTTTNRPTTPISGMIRYNTTTNQFEGYNGTSWSTALGASNVAPVSIGGWGSASCPAGYALSSCWAYNSGGNSVSGVSITATTCTAGGGSGYFAQGICIQGGGASNYTCSAFSDGSSNYVACLNLTTGRVVYTGSGSAWAQYTAANQAVWTSFATGGPYQFHATYAGGTFVFAENLSTGQVIRVTGIGGTWGAWTAAGSGVWPP